MEKTLSQYRLSDFRLKVEQLLSLAIANVYKFYQIDQLQSREQVLTGIEATAFATLATLTLNSPILEVRNTLEYLIQTEQFENVNIPVLPASFLIQQRFENIENYIEEQKFEQIIELACGLMPHDIQTLKKNPNLKYLCVDFPEIIRLKKDINQNIFPEIYDLVNYISGDLYDLSCWTTILAQIDPAKKTLIFCEGFVMYPDQNQWSIFASYLKLLMQQLPDAVFVHEDTLKAHIELVSDPDFTKLYKTLTNISEVTDLNTAGFTTQDEFESNKWLKYGFKIQNRTTTQALSKSSLNLGIIFDNEKKLHESTVGFRLWAMRLE